MAFSASPGVYGRLVDQSFVVSSAGLLAGGIVISSKRGSTDVVTVTSAKEFLDLYGIPSSDNPSMYSALRFLNRAGTLSVKRVINDAVAASGTLKLFGFDSQGNVLEVVNDPTTITPTDGQVVQVGLEPVGDFAGFAGQIATYVAISTSWEFVDQEDHLVINADNEGSWGNSVSVEIVDLADAPAGVFGVTVYESGEVAEQFEVSRDPNAKNGFGNNIYIENVINNRSIYINVNDNPSVVTSVPYTVGTTSLVGGSDDTVAPTSGDLVLAWDDFLNTNSVPANLLINAGWATPEVQTKMLAVAEARKDAVAILDIPEDTAQSVTDMIEYRKVTLAANTEYGGIYGGWLRIYDAYNDKEVTIPSSGDVAAVFEYTVEVANRWDAPAGLQRGIIPNALGVSKVLTEGERDQLYLAGINPVTTYGGASAVVWGQKTLQVQASALDRFNVVNSIIWINGRMVEALQPFVFEPNTVSTRDNINFLLTSFLENIQLQGGLYEFFVDTSTEINTPQVIDNNQLLVECWLKPTRTAEFIRVSTIITPTGVQLG